MNVAGFVDALLQNGGQERYSNVRELPSKEPVTNAGELITQRHLPPTTWMLEVPRPQSAASMRILLVEDDETVREAIEATLLDAGNIVNPANSVETALATVVKHPSPDLVLTDFNLGSAMNGIDLAEKLRRLGLRVPVLVVSARPELVNEHITRLPGTCFLAKPFSGGDLLTAIHRAARF